MPEPMPPVSPTTLIRNDRRDTELLLSSPEKNEDWVSEKNLSMLKRAMRVRNRIGPIKSPIKRIGLDIKIQFIFNFIQ